MLARRTWNSGSQASIKAMGLKELEGAEVRKSHDSQWLLKLCDRLGGEGCL